MFQKIKIPIILLAISAAIYGIYYYFFVHLKNNKNNLTPSISTNSASTAARNRSLSGANIKGCDTSKNNQLTTFPLKLGSEGLQVKQLQRFLKIKAINTILCPDGSWGPNTEAEFARQKVKGKLSNSVNEVEYNTLKLSTF